MINNFYFLFFFFFFFSNEPTKEKIRRSEKARAKWMDDALWRDEFVQIKLRNSINQSTALYGLLLRGCINFRTFACVATASDGGMSCMINRRGTVFYTGCILMQQFANNTVERFQ